MTCTKISANCRRFCRRFGESRDAIITKAVIAAALAVLTIGRGLAQNPLAQFQWEGSLASNNTQGTNTISNLVEIKPGVFVGTAQGGGQPLAPCPQNLQWSNQGCGTIYELDTTTLPNPTITVLWSFGGTPADGAQPTGRIDWDGSYIYGTTYGSDHCTEDIPTPPYCGTIYRFDPIAKTITAIYDPNFNTLTDGVNPVTGVVYDRKNGHLYGTTQDNKSNGLDTIFDLANAHNAAIGTVPNFNPLSGGNGPGSGLQALTLYSDGNLYGGTKGGNKILEFNTTSSKITVCASAFVNNVGAQPIGQLAIGGDGALYGVGLAPGIAPGAGLLFRVDPSGGCSGNPLLPFTVTHMFAGTPADPGTSNAGVLSAGGFLYGTGSQSVFGFGASALDTEQLLYSAPNLFSRAELTQGLNGFLYGTSLDDVNGTSPGAMFRVYPPPLDVYQFGTTGALDYGGPIVVDVQPASNLPKQATQHPGPRIYLAGESNSSLASLYGGQGSGAFYLVRFNEDQTLDTTFGATNIANNNGGFIQFGPPQILSGVPNSIAGIAVDYLGDVVVVGNTTTGIYGCTNVVGKSNIWVASFSPAGGFRWCSVFGSTQSDSASGLTLDLAGNIYVTGSSTGSMPGNTLQGSLDGFIARINRQGNHAVTVYEFAQAGENTTGAGSIAYCSGDLYLGVQAGPSAEALTSWVSKYNASSFSLGALLNAQLAANYYTGPVATDKQCNVYMGASQFSSSATGETAYFALQKYDNQLNLKWETDGPSRDAPLGGIPLPEDILSVAVDPTGAIYAAGGTNYSLYKQPLPTNCDTGGLTVLYCAGWFAAYEPVHGRLDSYSAREYGDVATQFADLALDMYGGFHVSGTTVGPVTPTANYDNSGDTFRMDFGPTAFSKRTATSTSLASSAQTVTHGTPVTFTATIVQDGNPAPTGSVMFITDGYAPDGYAILTSKSNTTGTVTYTISGLPVGTNDVWAVYSGTSALAPSTSTPVTVTVQ